MTLRSLNLWIKLICDPIILIVDCGRTLHMTAAMGNAWIPLYLCLKITSISLLSNIEQFPDYRLPQTDKNDDRLDVSQLCHNTLCIKLDHLVLEKHIVNKSRKVCKHLGTCNHTHEPACLLNEWYALDIVLDLLITIKLTPPT